MSDWPITKQIRTLSILSLATLGVVSIVAVGVTLYLGSNIAALRATTERTAVAQDIGEDVIEAQAAVLLFRSSPTQEVRDEVFGNLDESVEGERLLRGLIAHDPTKVESASALSSDLDQFRSQFSRLTELRELRNAQVEQITALGVNASEVFQGIMEQANSDGNAGAAFYSGVASISLLRAQTVLERFLVANNPADLEQSKEYLSLAKSDLSRLIFLLPGDKTQLDQARAALEEYLANAIQIGETIQERNGIRVQLEQLGTKVMDDLDQVIDLVREDQLSVVERSSMASTLIVIALTVASLAVTGLLALFSMGIAKRLSASVDQSVSEMRELAEGNLNVEISKTEAETELGDIARAMLVFRDTARATQQLQEEARAAEAAKQKAEEERRAQEEKAEAEASAARQREREETMQSLSESIGTVVEAAARGDFSQRVTASFDHDALKTMVASINSMMDNVETAVGETARVLEHLAGGDLTQDMRGNFQGIFNELSHALEETNRTLGQSVSDIIEHVRSVDGTTTTMVTQAGDLASRAEAQAAALEETSAAMEEMSASAKSSASQARESAQTAREATTLVDDAGEVVTTAITAMGDIKSASDAIKEIVAVIEGIAFQTNLLALNASVEAARAGSAGKGFAVVATEVRTLAQRSSEASQNIKGLIDKSASQVDRGVTLVEQTGQTLREIVDSVRDMAQTMESLTMAAEQQASGVTEVTGAVTQMDQMTQQNAQLSDDSRRAADELGNKMRVMRELMERFRLRSEAPEPQVIAAE